MKTDGEILTNLRFADDISYDYAHKHHENGEGYVYLGQRYSLKGKDQDKEIQRRIMAGWAAYANTGISSKATLPSA